MGYRADVLLRLHQLLRDVIQHLRLDRPGADSVNGGAIVPELVSRRSGGVRKPLSILFVESGDRGADEVLGCRTRAVVPTRCSTGVAFFCASTSSCGMLSSI
jgi:hypothetical protein